MAMMESDASPALSLVVPAYDEEDCVSALYARVLEVFGRQLDWELVFVDDGSADRTAQVLEELGEKDGRVRAILFESNCGQSTAIRVGIEQARAPLIATLDADLQNDPEDLIGMLEALGSNDAVVGYRVTREDGMVRLLSSRIANGIRNWISGDSIRDTGCSLKIFRAEAIRSIPLLDGMHRFIPTLLRYHGYSVIEHSVSHRPRLAGESKYGIRNRAWRGLKDLIAVRWMRDRIRIPNIRTSGTREGDSD